MAYDEESDAIDTASNMAGTTDTTSKQEGNDKEDETSMSDHTKQIDENNEGKNKWRDKKQCSPVTIDYETPYGVTIRLSFVRTRYVDNGTTAVIAMCKDDMGIDEEYAIVSVNLPQSASLPEGYQFADVNNVPTLIDAVEGHGLLERTGTTAQSGYVTYPLVRFAIDAIPEIPEE